MALVRVVVLPPLTPEAIVSLVEGFIDWFDYEIVG